MTHGHDLDHVHGHDEVQVHGNDYGHHFHEYADHPYTYGHDGWGEGYHGWGDGYHGWDHGHDWEPEYHHHHHHHHDDGFHYPGYEIPVHGAVVSEKDAKKIGIFSVFLSSIFFFEVSEMYFL